MNTVQQSSSRIVLWLSFAYFVTNHTWLTMNFNHVLHVCTTHFKWLLHRESWLFWVCLLCVKWRLSVPEEDEGEDGQVEDPEKLTGRRLFLDLSCRFRLSFTFVCLHQKRRRRRWGQKWLTLWGRTLRSMTRLLKFTRGWWTEVLSF